MPIASPARCHFRLRRNNGSDVSAREYAERNEARDEAQDEAQDVAKKGELVSNAMPPAWGEPEPRNEYLPPPAAQPRPPAQPPSELSAQPVWQPEPLPESYPYPLPEDSVAPWEHEGSKSYVTTMLLSFFGGVFGLDRFYLGKIGTGVLKLATFGGAGIWWLIDLLVTAFGGARDQWGYRLAGYDANKTKVWIGLAIASVLFAATEDGRLNGFGWFLAVAGGVGAGTWLWLSRKGKLDGRGLVKPAADPGSTTAPSADVAEHYDEQLTEKRQSASNEMTEWDERFNEFKRAEGEGPNRD